MSENKFFVCENCGNIVEVIQGTGAPAPFKVIEPGTVEASHEKHIPVVTVEGNKVKVVVGEVEHPMIEEHSILWVYLETDKGSQRKELAVGSAPVVTFALEDEKIPFHRLYNECRHPHLYRLPQEFSLHLCLPNLY